MTIIYLVRHGQTLFNQLKRVQGACDSPLTELGISQALEAKNYFYKQNINFQAVYSSSSERACDTAEIISGNTNYTRDKRLKEWNFGLFEGAPEYLNPPHESGEITYGTSFVKYGGESNLEVEHRMNECLTEIAQSNNGNVLVCSHAGAIRNFYLKWKKETDVDPTFSNCCILKFNYNSGVFEFEFSVDPHKEEVKNNV